MRRIPDRLGSFHLGDGEIFEKRELIEDADNPAVHGSDIVTLPMPGLDKPINITHHAGLIPLGKHNNLFYWHFSASKSPETAPLVIW